MIGQDSIEILGVKIAVTNLQKACETFEGWIRDNCKTYVCVAPVSMIVDCQADQEYRKIVNAAGMVTPDGMPLVWFSQYRDKKTISRTYGPDLMLSFCNLSQEKGYRHFFYGGTPEVKNLLSEKLRERFPRLNIVGHYVPGQLGLKEMETEETLEHINQLNPDVIWIGLGSPKQDYWMSQHRHKLNAPILVGVGAAFDFLSGVKKQAPGWMRRHGLEWFFRLCCEPRRLWKRYLLGNVKFLYYLLKDSLTLNQRKLG